MPTNTLTDRQCKAEAAGDKPKKLFDGGGLHLFVSTTGSKTWRLAYRIDGRPQTMSFGSYPAVTLAAARARRDEVKAILAEGGDPMAPRRVQRTGLTLEQASAEFWEAGATFPRPTGRMPSGRLKCTWCRSSATGTSAALSGRT